MAISDKRKYSKSYVFGLLESVKGKTLGEVDRSGQFERAKTNEKITGIAGDVVEQSVFGYKADNKQECDITIDGVLTELKTTGLRIPKNCLKEVHGKIGSEYNKYLEAKEPMSITGVTLEPCIQMDFDTSHFWEKSEHILFVFYEYKSYEAVKAIEYFDFPIVDYCYNVFSDGERKQLQKDWETVRDYLKNIYNKYPEREERNQHLIGFTHEIRTKLMLIDIAPSFKKVKTKIGESYQHPRYRFKKTFVTYIVKGHFSGTRTSTEISLKNPICSFDDLDRRCHLLSEKYKGHTLSQLKDELSLEADVKIKSFTSISILTMFGTDCKRLNQISDFTKAGIIAKTITITPTGKRTEDMKLCHIDFNEWADRDIDFEDSEIYSYFCEHSFLCPIFCEHDPKNPSITTFEGFKRFAFDDDFIENEVHRTWNDSRALIHRKELVWEYVTDKKTGEKKRNKSGSYAGAPNFPKGRDYSVFFRGGADDSREGARTECVNGIYMLPQFFWLKGSFIADKLKTINYL